MYFILRNLSRHLYNQDKYEGNFRYIHSRIREYAESISFYRSESQEKNNSVSTYEISFICLQD
jgi:ABC-type uncharacterized transport system fused permease/ATPase subunit